MTRVPLRATLAVLAVVLVAAYALLLRPFEETIAQRYADIAATRELLERDEAIVRRLPALAREHADLNARLARRHVRDAPAVIVDRFLHAAARVAVHDRIGIQNVAAATGPATSTGDLDLTITLRGSYPAVLRAMRDLAAAAGAAEITVAGFGNTARAGSSPALDATFHVTLLRETDAVSIRPLHPV